MKDNVNELLIEKLKEKGLNPEDFKDVLDAIKQPKYGLIWEDHPEHIEEHMKYNRPVLREEKDLRIDSGYGYTNNVLIEGDNLASLLAMREAGKKVDVIYIDPPYNTGNEFVYNDKIVDNEDSFRHSKWLSFMEKRLKVARDLMTDDGVIFVSIDDNEQANLKLLMDEVFGEENFIANIIWRKQGGGKHDSKYIAVNTEYVLVYRKSIILNGFNRLSSEGAHYKLEDERGRYMLRTWGGASLSYSKSLDYEVVAPDGSTIVAGGDIEKRNNRLSGNYSKKDWRWRGSIKTFKDRQSEGRIVIKKNKKGQWTVYEKVYQDSVKPSPYNSLYDDVTNRTGKNQLKNIFEYDLFSYPKPIELISHLVNLHPNKNAKVLDFFAGSGTTGHAVLELNKEDGGHRQFILCTNNENNICRDVTYERLRRVINGYTTPKGKEVEGLPANLIYLTVGETPKENNDVMFDMDEKQPLKTHIINNLRLKHHLHHPDELVDNLYRLRNGNTVHYVYFNDYIEDGVEEAILDSLDRDKTNIMHTVEGLVHDEVFNMMDDVKDIARLLNE